VLFACSGIAFESGFHVTRFLTSESLVRAFNDNNNRREGHGRLDVGDANHPSLILFVRLR
jgi:hypothetical protein